MGFFVYKKIAIAGGWGEFLSKLFGIVLPELKVFLLVAQRANYLSAVEIVVFEDFIGDILEFLEFFRRKEGLGIDLVSKVEQRKYLWQTE